MSRLTQRAVASWIVCSREHPAHRRSGRTSSPVPIAEGRNRQRPPHDRRRDRSCCVRARKVDGHDRAGEVQPRAETCRGERPAVEELGLSTHVRRNCLPWLRSTPTASGSSPWPRRTTWLNSTHPRASESCTGTSKHRREARSAPATNSRWSSFCLLSAPQDSFRTERSQRARSNWANFALDDLTRGAPASRSPCQAPSKSRSLAGSTDADRLGHHAVESPSQ